VAGYTLSIDFPEVNALQGAHPGTYEGFAAKMNPSGAALVYSTYLGGSGDDFVFGVAVDPGGNAYVAGETRSADFPLMNPLQGAFAGGPGDGFLTKLNPSGTGLAYSTYLGGSGWDRVEG